MATPVQVTFDFNQAKELAQNVGSATPLPNALATFTSNASTWEPGEFNNGVTSFGPNYNVFILHNSGTAQGANQRYAYVCLATQVPWILTTFSVNVSSNAAGHSPTNPVTVAIEASPRDDFFNAVVLGSISANQPQPVQSISFNLRIPVGAMYIRLRSTSPIPNGANYIAYSNAQLAGSTDVQRQTPIPPLITSSLSGQGMGSNSNFELLYDFNRAAEHAQVVASASRLANAIGVFASTASPWEPGEFANGVTSFGPGNNVFIIHDAGSAEGTNQ